MDENLTGFENLEMVGRLYHLGRRQSRERARELLSDFDLSDAGDRLVRTYSGECAAVSTSAPRWSRVNGWSLADRHRPLGRRHDRSNGRGNLAGS